MNKYDVAIIGGGPAGLTASVYASRANLKTVFIEKGAPGGKMVNTHKIENWSGDKLVSGPDLSIRMFDHAKAFGGEYKYGDVTKIVSNGEEDKVIKLASGDDVHAKAVVIATGMVERIPESVKGIHEYNAKGVSYCAICDGPIYSGKPTAVIGGGNAAIEEAQYLAQFSSHVYVFVRKPEELWADKVAVEELEAKDNVTLYKEAEIKELHGDGNLGSATIVVNGEEKELEVYGVFPYIGQVPVSSFVKHLNVTNDQGFITTDEVMETKEKNIFAIGDIRAKEVRQIATAVADGAIVGKILANRL